MVDLEKIEEERRQILARLKEIKELRKPAIEEARRRKEALRKERKAEKEKLEGHANHVIATLRNRGVVTDEQIFKICRRVCTKIRPYKPKKNGEVEK